MASNDTSSDIARGTADGGAAAARAFTHSSAAVVLPGAASRVASELGAVGAAAGAGGRGLTSGKVPERAARLTAAWCQVAV
jgi:hypothetical protein